MPLAQNGETYSKNPSAKTYTKLPKRQYGQPYITDLHE